MKVHRIETIWVAGIARLRELKKRPYWGNHFWTRGYCVDTVGLDEDMIRKYIKYQETREQRAEQRSLF